MNVLEVRGLSIRDDKKDEILVKNSSFQVKQGSCLAIAGESGSGKSLTCRALMKLNQSGLSEKGTVLYKGNDIAKFSKESLRKMRGREMYMIMQNGMTAFDPSTVIGVHLKQTAGEHYGWTAAETERNLHSALERVLLKNPGEVMNQYPHQLSGGMLQRTMIALALVLEPGLIIADEPTTALDAITQYEVMNELSLLRDRIGCTMIFVSHDLGLVRKVADELLIMKDGEIVERGETETVFMEHKQEYTKFLISARQVLSDNFMKIMEVR
ncbi:staphylopine uptake ABC transporter ATP-binding protein CntD [Rossellomorea aquimaris]|uniref:Nickel import ATP-binding protein NikD n=1 Tax=Rossellomorea aquimaris TaxID=189382 RepID=A0A1J6WK30_9BACI|nr:ABC transporter ATP-binding protein [Rossellomorea aquimaris]OIU68611.1 nickel import ATP-binding protein NikD [Rossellomorea aquimaris]